MNFTENTEIIELGNGIYARIHKNLTNSGIIVGDDSVLIIDSLRVPSFARDLKSDVKKITDKPIKYVVDTHSHWDHSWGNEEFLDSKIEEEFISADTREPIKKTMRRFTKMR